MSEKQKLLINGSREAANAMLPFLRTPTIEVHVCPAGEEHCNKQDLQKVLRAPTDPKFATQHAEDSHGFLHLSCMQLAKKRQP